MTDLIDFLVSEEAILVYIVALAISILYIMFYFFKKSSVNRRKRQNTMELKRLVADVKEFDLKSDKMKNKIDKVPVMATVKDSFKKEESIVNIELPKVEDKKIEKVKPIVESTPVVESVKEDIKIEENIPVIEPIKEEATIKEAKPVEEIKIEEVVPNIVREPITVVNRGYAAIPRIITEEIEKPVIEEVEEQPVITPIKEEITYTNIEPTKEEAKKELEEVTEKLEKEEDRNIELTEFERMQEDTAIISLDELMKKAGEMYEKNEEVQYQDEGNEPISLQDLEMKKMEAVKEEIKIEEEKEDIEQLTLDDLYNVKITPVSEFKPISEVKTFKSTPVISPVYGISKDETVNEYTDMELENTANYEKLDEEIRKTNEFLATLKELQKNLD